MNGPKELPAIPKRTTEPNQVPQEAPLKAEEVKKKINQTKTRGGSIGEGKKYFRARLGTTPWSP